MTQNVSLVRGRSCEDFYDSLAYSLYLINEGRIGSRAEREYLTADRARRQYKRLSSQIKSYKFEEDSDEEQQVESAPAQDDQTNFLAKVKVNESFESEASESLLDASVDSIDMENPMKKSVSADQALNNSRSSSTSRRSSVTRKGSSYRFKYKTCSICLSDFSKGEKIRVIPHCGHTFHNVCLEQWLHR